MTDIENFEKINKQAIGSAGHNEILNIVNVTSKRCANLLLNRIFYLCFPKNNNLEFIQNFIF